mmetsp:Transcript_61968/g.147825  ORF Transcript_61968/g.147825 Transcript_61968/m.147825 type:complete len:404 (-) Transcript_61968:344-1555(-)
MYKGRPDAPGTVIPHEASIQSIIPLPAIYLHMQDDSTCHHDGDLHLEQRHIIVDRPECGVTGERGLGASGVAHVWRHVPPILAIGIGVLLGRLRPIALPPSREGLLDGQAINDKLVPRVVVRFAVLVARHNEGAIALFAVGFCSVHHVAEVCHVLVEIINLLITTPLWAAGAFLPRLESIAMSIGCPRLVGKAGQKSSGPYALHLPRIQCRVQDEDGRLCVPVRYLSEVAHPMVMLRLSSNAPLVDTSGRVCQVEDVLDLLRVDCLTFCGLVEEEHAADRRSAHLLQSWHRLLQPVVHVVGMQVCRKASGGAASQQNLLCLGEAHLLQQSVKHCIDDSLAAEVQGEGDTVGTRHLHWLVAIAREGIPIAVLEHNPVHIAEVWVQFAIVAHETAAQHGLRPFLG